MSERFLGKYFQYKSKRGPKIDFINPPYRGSIQTAKALKWELQQVSNDIATIKTNSKNTKQALNTVDDLDGPLIGKL